MKRSVGTGKICVLTSRSSWLFPFSREFVGRLRDGGREATLFDHHKDVRDAHDVVFYLSYFQIVPPEFLSRHGMNLVVHESDLPRGKGWSPLFWQVLEGLSSVPVVLFEAMPHVDSGKIYLREMIELQGHELHDEIRAIQANKTFELCDRYLAEADRIVPLEQQGIETFYDRRSPSHSELDIDRSLREQFNLLRVCSNDHFPAYFEHLGHRFVIRITKAESTPDSN